MFALLDGMKVGFNALPSDAQKTLLLSLIPALVVVLCCSILVVRRRKIRDPYWVAALVTAPLTIFKVFLAWFVEAVATLTFPLGWVIKGLSIFLFFPEGLIYWNYLDKAQRVGVPLVQAATLWAPVGSMVIGALTGFALRNSLKTAERK